MSNKQVCKPLNNDVLFGKGRKCQNHHGNCYFRDGVQRNKIQYIQATKTAAKDAIANHILHSVKRLNPPGRFLKKADDGKYYASSDKDALAKIKQALRENSKDVKDKISGATMDTKRSATTMLSKTKNASVDTTKAVAVKGDTKRSATDMLSKTKNASLVTNAVAMKKGTAKRSRTPPKVTATTASKASVVTKDDMVKLANLILDMD